MSRAFVKEMDGIDVPDDFPERPVSAHPNFVTARGLQLIEAQVREFEQQREQAKLADDRPALARIERDLRYWQLRKASARLTEPETPAVKIRFGMRVTLREDTGKERKFVLVGEDEADPASGLISWASPVGHRLLGNEVGDEIEFQGKRAEIVHIDIP
jgi:transcription elongation GreA/GreB family factor